MLSPIILLDNPDFQEPDIERVKEFTSYINQVGLRVTIRHGKGQDILGACGQLGGL
jgi:adenine C2-methylase RlmN of 23S rRNA A2503 and tRNA A37